jgi:hypothetical protein
MRWLTRVALAAGVCALVGVLPVRAEAALLLDPTNADCSAPGSNYHQDLDFLEGEPPDDNGCGLDTTGFELLYKHDFDDNEESGLFATSYDTTYFGDPNDANVTYVGGASISCGTCWLVAKDGAANPGWYGWDLEALNWNGTDELQISDLFLGIGAISHVAIWGGENGGGGDGGTIPEPASLALFGVGLLGGMYRLRQRRAAA